MLRFEKLDTSGSSRLLLSKSQPNFHTTSSATGRVQDPDRVQDEQRLQSLMSGRPSLPRLLAFFGAGSSGAVLDIALTTLILPMRVSLVFLI